ncbi:MAG: RNA polymerase sigma factor SigJ [Gemmatirosa sp.]|nr:RNA polymerase sigma factor SigJ [Gemmatirosa sp.]
MDTPHTDLDVEPYRPRLFGIAYRMLGDAAEAEDLVQETFLRWHQADQAAIAAPEGWLVAVVSRLAIDRLRKAATERTTYVGPWLPEPIATDPRDGADYATELASDLSMALLVLLERLAPEERAAFLLREVYDVRYDEIARILSMSEPAARQMVHRARTRVRADRARFTPAPDAHERLLHRFLAALEADDQEALLAVFADDVTLMSDGGGKVSAARNVVRGPERIARMLLGVERKWGALVTHRLRRVNGELALVSYFGDRVVMTTTVHGDGDRIGAVYRVLNPEKLRHV